MARTYGKAIKDSIKDVWERVLMMEPNQEIRIVVKNKKIADTLVWDLHSARKYSEENGLLSHPLVIEKARIPGSTSFVITINKTPPLKYMQVTKLPDKLKIEHFIGSRKITEKEEEL